MPELPEVETVRRGLHEAVVGRTITAVTVRLGDQLRPSPEVVAEGLAGRRVTAARRYGKHLFLDVDGAWTLAAHLRMTGQLRAQLPEEPVEPHTHVEFHLDDGRSLRWRDVRRFGWLHLVRTAELDKLPSLARMGPDALEIDRPSFVSRVRAARRMMKALLLAQDVVCGVGNIYADEILWRSRLHPRQSSEGLGSRKLNQLYDNMRCVLTEAIEARGSSIDGQYLTVDGLAGDYQVHHAVYGRAGSAAPCCGQPVSRTVIASRSTFYCPRCQRKR